MKFTRPTLADYLAKKQAKKSRRKDNARFIAKTQGKKVQQSRSKIRAQIWNLTSLIVRMRDRKIADGNCLICRARPITVCYHIIPAMEGDSIRYDLNNLVGACSSCNYAEFRWRRRYAEKHRAIFGKEKIEMLEAQARETVKFSTSDLITLRDFRKTQLETRNF